MREIAVAGRKIGEGHAPFIVAEAGINHNGSIDLALQMVTAAKEAGCDAIKFATLKAAEFCNPAHMISYRYDGELVTESELDMFRRSELPDDAWRTIKAECDRHEIIFFSTPQNESDLDLLMSVGVPCIKVGSDDLTNLALLRAYASRGLPMILSTGMADAFDIHAAFQAINERRDEPAPLVICACTSEYPCPPQDANLLRVKRMRGIFKHTPIGFSDHTTGSEAAVVAAALGACYFEKHFTMDNTLRGPDHDFSASPNELWAWADGIRLAHVLLGDGEIKPTEQERVNRVNWRRASGQQIRGAA